MSGSITIYPGVIIEWDPDEVSTDRMVAAIDTVLLRPEKIPVTPEGLGLVRSYLERLLGGHYRIAIRVDHESPMSELTTTEAALSEMRRRARELGWMLVR